MNLEELKLKYKALPLWARFSLMGILGLIPGVYLYFEEGQGYEERLAEIQTREQLARTEFERSRQRKASLPKLEEQLAFTEEQLNKAKKLLPDQYIIEDVLEKAASIANDSRVLLRRFKPLQEIAHEKDGYRYVELPIETEITGDYQSIVNFFDRIVHLESTIFVRNISIAPAPKEQVSALPQSTAAVSRPSAIPPLAPFDPSNPPSPAQLNAMISNRTPPTTGTGAGIQPDAGQNLGLLNSSSIGAGQQPPSALGEGTALLDQATDSSLPFLETAQFNLVIYRSMADTEVTVGTATPAANRPPQGLPAGATPPQGQVAR